MVVPGDRLRSRLLGGGADASADAGLDVLANRLADDEPVVHAIRTDEPVLHESGDVRDSIGSEDGGALVAGTDRRIVASDTDGRTTVEESLADVRSVAAADGLLSSSLTVDVWGNGTYRIVPRNADVAAVAADIERRADLHQRVAATLEAAREAITNVGKALEAGEREAVTGHRDTAREQLRTASEQIERADLDHVSVLRNRVATAETELARTTVRGHVARAQQLADRGDRATGREEWDRALSAYEAAGDHLATARDRATESDLGLADAIDAEIDDLRDRVDRLRARPLELAEAARERAQEATTLDDEIPSWEAAFEGYRAALTAGWGRLDFRGDEDALRMGVEWVVANVIRSRRAMARTLAEAADERRERDPEAARMRYDAAVEQVTRAESLAREFRAGDPDALAARRAELVADRAAVEGSSSDER